MPLSFQVSGPDKDNLVVSLAAILLSDSNLDLTSENIDAVISASGNTVAPYYSALYASYIEKSGGLEKFFAGPSAGGAAPSGSAPSAGTAAPAAAKVEEKPKVEEVDALDGGMDMFGGSGGGGGDY